MGVVLQALDGETCHEYQHRNPRNSAQLQSRDNARRREMGQKPLTTAQVVDESAILWRISRRFSSAVTTSFGQQTQVIQGRRWKPPVSPRETLAG